MDKDETTAVLFGVFIGFLLCFFILLLIPVEYTSKFVSKAVEHQCVKYRENGEYYWVDTNETIWRR